MLSVLRTPWTKPAAIQAAVIFAVAATIAVNMAAAPPDQRQEIVQSLRGGEVTIPQLTEPLAEAFSDIYIRTQDEIEQIIADAQDHLR